MIHHSEISDFELKRLIKHGLSWAGNKKLKIYGKMDCYSGKRMKRENRVFFESEAEAITMGFRPCGNCLRSAYKGFDGSKFPNN